MIRMLQDLTGIDPVTIPLDDPGVMSLFQSTEALGITPEQIGGCKLGCLAWAFGNMYLIFLQEPIYQSGTPFSVIAVIQSSFRPLPLRTLSMIVKGQGQQHLENVMADYKRRSDTLSKKEQDTNKDMKIVQEMYAI